MTSEEKVEIKSEIKKFFQGEMADDEATLGRYSRDASLLAVWPQLVLFPKNAETLVQLVKWVSENKVKYPELSLTARAAGTDMSGGPLNESLIVDCTTYLHAQAVDATALTAVVEPGVFYRDLESVTTPQRISLPVFPASKQLAALGGMVMNNAGGEKTLRYGQTNNFVQELSMVLADGAEYTFWPLNKAELEEKMSLNDFESEVYRQTFALVRDHYDLIQKMKPQTTKDSSGYALWRVWDKTKNIFDLTQLFTGSQGTLGLMTKAKMRLIKDQPHKKLIVIFCQSWNDLPAVVNALLPFNPESMETFDDTTLKLGLKFMPEIARRAHQSFWRFAWRFWPETWIGLKMLGLPKLIVLAQLAEDESNVLEEKTTASIAALKKFPVFYRVIADPAEAEKYWVMRRESFNLLRQHVRGRRTAPFIDDFAIAPAKMPEFLPQLLQILKDHGIKANIAGHAGDGNYHIIPLMDTTLASERAKIVPVAQLVYDLVKKFGGTITAEHNDGIIRTPFVEQMFGVEMYQLFVKVKRIFDPQNIFNPGKKVGGSLDYLQAHLARD